MGTREEILNIIEKNSRIDVHELSVLIGAEEILVANELKALEDEGIICGYHTMVDWSKTSLDKVNALIEVTVTPTRGQGFDNIAERIYKYPEVTSVYLMSGLRLLILPGLFLLAAKLFGFSFEFTLLGVAAMSMPIGLNTIVIPAAYGEVPEEATGMVMLSHLASALTIPFMFWLMTVIGFG